jgi:hypothetical protein
LKKKIGHTAEIGLSESFYEYFNVDRAENDAHKNEPHFLDVDRNTKILEEN